MLCRVQWMWSLMHGLIESQVQHTLLPERMLQQARPAPLAHPPAASSCRHLSGAPALPGTRPQGASPRTRCPGPGASQAPASQQASAQAGLSSAAPTAMAARYFAVRLLAWPCASLCTTSTEVQESTWGRRRRRQAGGQALQEGGVIQDICTAALAIGHCLLPLLRYASASWQCRSTQPQHMQHCSTAAHQGQPPCRGKPLSASRPRAHLRHHHRMRPGRQLPQPRHHLSRHAATGQLQGLPGGATRGHAQGRQQRGVPTTSLQGLASSRLAAC